MDKVHKISINGHIWEAGYKIGMALGVCQNYPGCKEKWEKCLNNVEKSIKDEPKKLGFVGEVMQRYGKDTFREVFYRTNFLDGTQSVYSKLEKLGFNLKNERAKWVQVILFVLGITGGRLEICNKNEFWPGAYVQPLVCDLFWEKDIPGVYENADLLFLVEKGNDVVLACYEFKLWGATKQIYEFLLDSSLERQNPYNREETSYVIPPRVLNPQLMLAVENNSAFFFVRHFIEQVKKGIDHDTGTIIMSPEMRYLLQAFCYVFDYLARNYKSDEKVRKVNQICTKLMYPAIDGVTYRLKIFRLNHVSSIQNENDNYREIESLAGELIELYERVLNLTKEEKIPTEDMREISKISHKLLFEISLKDYCDDTLKKINDLLEKMKDRNEKSKKGCAIEIIPERAISVIRGYEDKSREVYVEGDVARCVRNFYENDPWGKVLVLLHSTGSGKTTSVRKVILERVKNQKDMRLVFLYFAPRKGLIVQEVENVMDEIVIPIKSECGVVIYEEMLDEFIGSKYGKNNGEKEGDRDKRRQEIIKTLCEMMEVDENKLSSSNQLEKTSRHFRIRRGDVTEVSSKSVKGKIKEVTNRMCEFLGQGKRFVAGFATIHAITREKNWGKETIDHIKEKLMPDVEYGKYKVVIVIDELTGASNGLFALESMLNAFAEYKDRIAIFVFDATLHSKGVFETVWNQFQKRGYLASSFFTVDFERDGKFPLKNGWVAHVYSGYTYPARKLIIKEQFLWKDYKYFLEKYLISDGKKWDEIDPQKIEAFTYKRLADIIIRHIEEVRPYGKGVYVYIQDRKMIHGIRETLELCGYGRDRVFYCTRNDRDDKQEWNKYDAVISTSTLSRGISFGEKFDRALIICTHFWGVEEGVIEDLQASARIRGGNDEERVKEICRIYAIFPKEKRRSLETRVESWYENFLEDELIEDTQDSSEIKSLIERALYLTYWKNLLESQLDFANLTLNLYKSYYLPTSGKIVAITSSQIRPYFIPTLLNEIDNYVDFIGEVLQSKIGFSDQEKEELSSFQEKLRSIANVNFLKIEREVKRSILRGCFKYAYPFFLVEDVNVRTSFMWKDLEEMSILAEEVLKILGKRSNYRIRAKQMEKWLEEIIGADEVLAPGIFYIPTLVMVYDCIPSSFLSRKFFLSPHITRFGIQVLGSRLGYSVRLEISDHNQNKDCPIFPIANTTDFGWLSGEWIKVQYPYLNALIKGKNKEEKQEKGGVINGGNY